MKWFLLLLTFPLTLSAAAQFWFVSDNDGFANVRDSPTTRSPITDTLNNGHFVYTYPDAPRTGSWRQILYTHRGTQHEGYIYYDRVRSISGYDSIPMRSSSENTATCSRDSIKVIITREKFDKTKYHISYRDHDVEKVNGKAYWGTDGETPRSEYKSIVIVVGSRRIILPHAAIENLFEPTVWNTEVHYDRVNDIFYISSENSDGAGSYDVVWRVVKGVYTDRDIEAWD